MKIRQIATILMLTTFFYSCSEFSSPSFVGLKNVKIVPDGLRNLKLQGVAQYNNSNPIGGKLTHTEIDVKMDDISVFQILNDKEVVVPANSDFSIPVDIKFALKKLFKENDNLIGNALRKLKQQELKLTYSGFVTIKLAGLSFDVPVDYSEKIGVGLNFKGL